MSLTDEMADDFEQIEQLAERIENDLTNGDTESAEERVGEIKDIAESWQ